MAYQTLEQKKLNKSKLIEKFQKAKGDAGSTEVQVALLTTHINELSKHLQTHKKDYSSQRGLLKMVGQRRGLLEYLKSYDAKRYTKVLKDLDLRK